MKVPLDQSDSVLERERANEYLHKCERMECVLVFFLSLSVLFQEIRFEIKEENSRTHT